MLDAMYSNCITIAGNWGARSKCTVGTSAARVSAEYGRCRAEPVGVVGMKALGLFVCVGVRLDDETVSDETARSP